MVPVTRPLTEEERWEKNEKIHLHQLQMEYNNKLMEKREKDPEASLSDEEIEQLAEDATRLYQSNVEDSKSLDRESKRSLISQWNEKVNKWKEAANSNNYQLMAVIAGGIIGVIVALTTGPILVFVGALGFVGAVVATCGIGLVVGAIAGYAIGWVFNKWNIQRIKNMNKDELNGQWVPPENQQNHSNGNNGGGGDGQRVTQDQSERKSTTKCGIDIQALTAYIEHTSRTTQSRKYDQFLSQLVAN